VDDLLAERSGILAEPPIARDVAGLADDVAEDVRGAAPETASADEQEGRREEPGQAATRRHGSRHGLGGGPDAAPRASGGLFLSNAGLKRERVLDACVTKSG